MRLRQRYGWIWAWVMAAIYEANYVKLKPHCESINWCQGTRMLLVANSTPMVDLDSRLNSFFVNRDRRFDLPTPESPINTTLKR
ncbi:hypothetical protein IEQ34_017947 [Dendrobium chrysotoxum]|uniref:Uncharacterized protein n=1 Tax=Dendrobium chrysotoxum TaxID=161865 RepID=A0AAV7GD51_DENCH|nr:hypothetical protein IEQ34_017947 [Dendrobium chrysotoxum]